MLMPIALISISSLAQNTFPTAAGTNVGIGTSAPTTRLEVTSATAGTSGVKLTNLTSASTTTTGNNKALSVDASGNLVLVPVTNTSANLYTSDGTLATARTVTMAGGNLTFNPSTANSQFFINGTSGNVGLGNIAPTVKLDVTGVVKAKDLYASNLATNATSFASSTEWYKNANVFGAGYEMSDATIAGTVRRMFNFYDLHSWGSSIPVGSDLLAMNIIDRRNKMRFEFRASVAGASNNGSSTFQLSDKNEAEFFKIIDNGLEKIVVQLAKPDSKLSIGTTADYAPGLPHKLVVQNGSALIEGNILTNSNIGIGSTSFTDGTDTYRLSVAGAIRAQRVKVYTTWADYVFEAGYKLASLEEVEKHIKDNGHLKDIPSAKEVETNGIELGEMNKLLLQKVEELTLYVIELNKELQAVKTRLNKN